MFHACDTPLPRSSRWGPHPLRILLREADVVVAATPIFFFNMTAQLKALVDRCQTFWARKYRFGLKDPLCKQRKGVLLAVGATKFKNLFDGLELGVEYFFDALDADYARSLTYGGIEHPGDIDKHATVQEDARRAVAEVVGPLTWPTARFEGRNRKSSLELIETERNNSNLVSNSSFRKQIGYGNKPDRIGPVVQKT